MSDWNKYQKESIVDKNLQFSHTMNVWIDQHDASLIEVARIVRKTHELWDKNIGYNESIKRAIKISNRDLE